MTYCSPANVQKIVLSNIEEVLSVFISSWYEEAKVHEHDTLKENIMLNGIECVRMLLIFLERDVPLDEIKSLCYKIANERMSAGINVADFVYNSDLAKNKMVYHIVKMELKTEDTIYFLEKINEFYNKLIYYTVEYYYELYYRQINEQKNFIEETHKDRLTILGQMSAGFVHEFRNPLTSIIGFVKLLQQEHPKLSYLDIVSYELEQLNFRISQFLHVSKKDFTEEKQYKLFQDIFNEINEFLYPSLLESNTQVIYDIQKECSFFGRLNEMKQVLLNILMNSIDALENIPKNKKIFIDVTQDQKEITISIANNGPQITKDKIKTIFEPFVTTKKLGTGIGLFVSKQIIEKHNGTIDCISNPLVTYFIIKLPII